MIYGTDDKDRARAVRDPCVESGLKGFGSERLALECKQCGGREFHVVVGDYYTAIQCPQCEWRECIHDG